MMKKSLTIIIALTLSCFALSAWEGVLDHKEGESELAKLPTLERLKDEGEFVRIKVTNDTKTALLYTGYENDRPQQFKKYMQHGAWKYGVWDWCGTGMNSFTLKKSESVIFKFRKKNEPTQIYTLFRNFEDTKQYSLVLVYEE